MASPMAVRPSKRPRRGVRAATRKSDDDAPEPDLAAAGESGKKCPSAAPMPMPPPIPRVSPARYPAFKAVHISRGDCSSGRPAVLGRDGRPVAPAGAAAAGAAAAGAAAAGAAAAQQARPGRDAGRGGGSASSPGGCAGCGLPGLPLIPSFHGRRGPHHLSPACPLFSLGGNSTRPHSQAHIQAQAHTRSLPTAVLEGLDADRAAGRSAVEAEIEAKEAAAMEALRREKKERLAEVEAAYAAARGAVLAAHLRHYVLGTGSGGARDGAREGLGPPAPSRESGGRGEPPCARCRRPLAALGGIRAVCVGSGCAAMLCGQCLEDHKADGRRSALPGGQRERKERGGATPTLTHDGSNEDEDGWNGNGGSDEGEGGARVLVEGLDRGNRGDWCSACGRVVNILCTSCYGRARRPPTAGGTARKEAKGGRRFVRCRSCEETVCPRHAREHECCVCGTGWFCNGPARRCQTEDCEDCGRKLCGQMLCSLKEGCVCGQRRENPNLDWGLTIMGEMRKMRQQQEGKVGHEDGDVTNRSENDEGRSESSLNCKP